MIAWGRDLLSTTPALYTHLEKADMLQHHPADRKKGNEYGQQISAATAVIKMFVSGG